MSTSTTFNKPVNDEIAELNSKITPVSMTVDTSGSAFSTKNVYAKKTGYLLHIKGYFSNTTNTSGVVAVVKNCYPDYNNIGHVSMPVQCDDGSVGFIGFESSNNNIDLTIICSRTLTANKYVRFDGVVDCL